MRSANVSGNGPSGPAVTSDFFRQSLVPAKFSSSFKAPQPIRVNLVNVKFIRPICFIVLIFCNGALMT